MATTRGKGPGKGAPADPAAEAAPRPRRTRTRAPEDEIGGVAAPEKAAPAKRGRSAASAAGVAEAPAAEAPRPSRRKAPGSGVAAEAEPAPPAAKKKGGSTRETYAETAARRRREKEVDQLQADLRAFAQARPGGWGHDDWVSFLAHLGERGHDVSNPDGIGSRLEQERLAVVLGGIEGLGPKRVQSLVDRFETLWSLRHAGVDELSGVSGMTRPLAERVADELRTNFPG